MFGVCLSLLIVMLLLECLGHSSGPGVHRHCPVWSQCCGQTNLCGSYYCKTHISSNHQGTWKRQGLLPTGFGGYRACPWPHSKVTGREREREKAWTWGSAFIRVKGGVPRVFWVHSILGNLNIGAEIKVWDRKSRVTQKVSDRGQTGLPKRRTLWVGWPGSLTSCVAANVFIPNGCL